MMRQSVLPHGGPIDVRRRSPYLGTTSRPRPGHPSEATLATPPDRRPRQTGADRPGHRRRPGMLTQGCQELGRPVQSRGDSGPPRAAAPRTSAAAGPAGVSPLEATPGRPAPSRGRGLHPARTRHPTDPRAGICLALASWCARNELKRPSASVLAVLARGVRGPDANGPVPHCAAPLPAPPRPTRPVATNSSPGACSASTPPSR